MVTLFKNFNEVVEHKSLPAILEEIHTGKYKHAIVYLRKSLAEKKKKPTTKPKNPFRLSPLQESLLEAEKWNSWLNIPTPSFWTLIN